ncbi:MAG: GAF domain-containing protein [Chloroflexi bacterium]|nr:GAF domain-containing protein [Chloroflexota bacterium]
MSKTKPSPPKWPQPPAPSLHQRWRWYMMLGLNALVVLVLGSASVILFLNQRQAVLRQHESAARQAQVTIQHALTHAEQTLHYAAEAQPADRADLIEPARLVEAIPGLHRVALVGEGGRELDHFPASRTSAIPDWGLHPAWLLARQGQVYTHLQTNPARLTLGIPLPDHSGALIAQLDPEQLWQDALAAGLGDSGYLYLLTADGRVLITAPDQAQDPVRSPADFTSFRAARDGGAATMLYRGLSGEWVVGRAEHIAGTDLVLISETPFSAFTVPLALGITLWLLAIGLTAVAGEWMIRRILRTVLKPLGALHQGARAVESGDFSYRVRVPPRTDRELADLGYAFNDMIARLQASQAEIKAYTHEIESIVDLRARELSRKVLHLEVAAEVSSKIATLLDPRALIREVVTLLKSRFQMYHADVLLVDSSGAIQPVTSQPDAAPPLTTRDHQTNAIAWAAHRGQTLYIPDVSAETRYQPSPERPASQSALIIPLKFAENVVGVLNLEADHRQAFPRDEIAVLESLANEIAVSMHNAQVFAALETANRDLAQATLQAKQSNVLKSRFLLNASHKLRTPLNAIIGYSETILSGIYGEVAPTALDRQRRILENGRLLQALIEDMLDLSAIETGSVALDLAWIELPPLLDEVMIATRALHQTGFAEHDLALRLELDGALPPVYADLNRLRYILINLMSNAVKFTEAGEVVMSVRANGTRLLLRVRDTGPGISEDEVAHLFMPFQHMRGSTEGEGKGTGLGLTVSRLLAALHGGDLTVESAPNQGSTFTLALPLRPEGAPPPPVTNTPPAE